MSGHTPGPWLTSSSGVYALDETRRVSRFSAQIDGGYSNFIWHKSVANTRTSDDELAANKALIASAPDLKADNDRLRAVNAELLAVVRAQGVHHDIVSLVDVHLPEMPQNWRPFLSDLAKRAAANIARADAAIAKAKGDDHDAR